MRPIQTTVVVSMLALSLFACAGTQTDEDPWRPAKRTDRQAEGDVKHSSQDRITPGPVETRQLERPIIKAVVIPMTEYLVLASYAGELHLTNRGRASKNPPVGTKLENGDLLQLGAKTVVSVEDPRGKAIELTAATSEWFAFVVR